MYAINLIDPPQSQVTFKTMLFPDGQPHIKIDLSSAEQLSKKEPFRILSRVSSSDDLLLILFLKNALDELEFEYIELHISYLMAARMDRVMQEGEPFSLKAVASVINQCAFKKVLIFDPHSEVSTALINRSYAVTNHRFVSDALASYFSFHPQQEYCLVSPDAGALKKIHKLAAYLEVHDVIECSKQRDVLTGHLTGFNISYGDPSGKTCFIIDDICDGGGTFIGIASMLREKGAAKIILIVSHGIFSKGNSIEHVDEILTTDSYKKQDELNSFKVETYFKNSRS